MKIEKAKQLTARKFKRMTGVSRQTFELIVELVKASEKKKKKTGRRPKLMIEDQVLTKCKGLSPRLLSSRKCCGGV